MYVSHQVPSEGQGIIGLTFPEGQIFTFGVPQVIQAFEHARANARLPHFFVFIDDRTKQQALNVKIEYIHLQGTESKNSIRSYKAYTENMRDNWREKFYSFGD